MRRIISISSGCFYSRGKGKYYLVDKDKSMDKVISLASKLGVDGMEILFGNAKELSNYKISKNSLKIVSGFKFNTIHAPFGFTDKEKLIFSNDVKSKKVLKRLYELYDKTNANNLNLHPTQIKNFKMFNTKNYQHSIENMEMKHNLKIKDYKKILKENSFRFVLDATHASEGDELNSLLNSFKKDIIYFHLSANYYNHLHLPMHSLNKEYLKQFEIIKKTDFPIVLESQIGTKDIEEYKKEIDFVRKWLKK